MADVMRRKSLDALAEVDSSRQLKRTLGWPHLIALGVGAIVGTGIYTLTGISAGLAGPAVILSFAIAGVVCACAALAYAEMATLIPASGSAYTYTYSVLGEILAWIVGWSLILEYTVVCSAVAVGWSGYAGGLIRSADWGIPPALLAGPMAGGAVNLPAILISFVVAGVLAIGTKESANINFVLVLVKMAALLLFVVIALRGFDPARFHPFMPFGFLPHDVNGTKQGVLGAAALIFFAFYGFDAVSTASEETKNPGRDLKLGIIGSMLICTALYMAVAAAALGAANYSTLANSPEPLAFVLRQMGQPLAATLIASAAVIALPTVLLAFMYGQSRIFFVMARDGLLPQALSRVNPRTHTPIAMTLVTGVIVAAMAGFLSLREIAELANTGTLCAFIAVSVCMLVLRVRDPDRPRVFKAPLAWVIGPVAIVGCIGFFFSLPVKTEVRFLIWNAIGIAVYFAYARSASRLAKATRASA